MILDNIHTTTSTATNPAVNAGISVTANGYVDLGTTAGYLSGLRAGNLAISGWFFASGQANGKRIFSAEVSNNTELHVYPDVDTDTLFCRWTGTSSAFRSPAAAQGVWHNLTMVFDGGSGDAHFCIDGGTPLSDVTVAGLVAVQSTIIRLGAQANDGTNGSVATFGPFAILDLSGTTINNSAETQSLALAITNAGRNGDAMRIAIMGHDADIVGKIWKLNDLGIGTTSSGSATIERYNLADGAAEGKTNSVTSVATGIII